MRIKFFILIFFLSVISPGQALALEKLLVSYASPGIGNSLLQLANDNRIFEKNGLNVSYILIPKAIRTLIAGETHVTFTGGASVSDAALSGFEIVIIAGIQNNMDYSIYSSPGLKRLEDLKGKKVATGTFGSTADFAFRYVLKRKGIKPDKDVVMIQMGGQGGRFAGLIGGSVDATILGMPYTLNARKMGKYELLSLKEFDMPYLHTGVSTTKSFILKRENSARQLVKSIAETTILFKTNKEVTLRSIKKFTKIENEEILDATYKLYSEIIPLKPYPEIEGIKMILDERAETDPRALNFDIKRIVDLRFIEELEKKGFWERFKK